MAVATSGSEASRPLVKKPESRSAGSSEGVAMADMKASFEMERG
jgi:hypothetical protein